MSDTEKLSFNLSAVDLGQIDLLIEQGFYSSRTDFLRTAIRNLLNTHAEVVKQVVTRKAMAIGVLQYSRANLERHRAAREQIDIKAVGVLVLDDDITPELALATINSIEVRGVLRASDALKAALQPRMK
jgi:Arc/MetJ-type ribon-helix-helix transcriptional regulator